MENRSIGNGEGQQWEGRTNKGGEWAEVAVYPIFFSFNKSVCERGGHSCVQRDK